MLTPHASQHIAKNGIKVVKENTKKQTRDNLKNSSELSMMPTVHNVSEPVMCRFKRCPFEQAIAYKNPGNTVFVNPNISDIIIHNPPNDIDIKSIKKFKPLFPDYELSSTQEHPVDVVKESYEDFDWYQTRDMYEPFVGWQTTDDTEVSFVTYRHT